MKNIDKLIENFFDTGKVLKEQEKGGEIKLLPSPEEFRWVIEKNGWSLKNTQEELKQNYYIKPLIDDRSGLMAYISKRIRESENGEIKKQWEDIKKSFVEYEIEVRNEIRKKEEIFLEVVRLRTSNPMSRLENQEIDRKLGLKKNQTSHWLGVIRSKNKYLTIDGDRFLEIKKKVLEITSLTPEEEIKHKERYFKVINLYIDPNVQGGRGNDGVYKIIAKEVGGITPIQANRWVNDIKKRVIAYEGIYSEDELHKIYELGEKVKNAEGKLTHPKIEYADIMREGFELTKDERGVWSKRKMSEYLKNKYFPEKSVEVISQTFDNFIKKPENSPEKKLLYDYNDNQYLYKVIAEDIINDYIGKYGTINDLVKKYDIDYHTFYRIKNKISENKLGKYTTLKKKLTSFERWVNVINDIGKSLDVIDGEDGRKGVKKSDLEKIVGETIKNEDWGCTKSKNPEYIIKRIFKDKFGWDVINDSEAKSALYEKSFYKQGFKKPIDRGRESIIHSLPERFLIDSIIDEDISVKYIVDYIIDNVNEFVKDNKINKYDIISNQNFGDIIKSGDKIEVKDKGNSDDFLAEPLASPVKVSGSIIKNTPEYLKKYNDVIDGVYHYLNGEGSSTGVSLLKRFSDDLKGIFIKGYIFVPITGLEFYISNKGYNTCVNHRRIVIRYRVKEGAVTYKLIDGELVKNTDNGGINFIKDYQNCSNEEPQVKYPVEKTDYVDSYVNEFLDL